MLIVAISDRTAGCEYATASGMFLLHPPAGQAAQRPRDEGPGPAGPERLVDERPRVDGDTRLLRAQRELPATRRSTIGRWSGMSTLLRRRENAAAAVQAAHIDPATRTPGAITSLRPLVVEVGEEDAEQQHRGYGGCSGDHRLATHVPCFLLLPARPVGQGAPFYLPEIPHSGSACTRIVNRWQQWRQARRALAWRAMCGRYTNTAEPHALEQRFGLRLASTEGTRRYNVAPTEPVLAVVTAKDVRRAGGPDPPLGPDPDLGQGRPRGTADDQRPSGDRRGQAGLSRPHRHRRPPRPAPGRRLLRVAAPGGSQPARQPFRFTVDAGEPFALAGLWTPGWVDGEGSPR